MAFAISTWHLPPLYDYDEAKERYNSVRPIRGRTDDTRPLGKRSAQHMRIEKNYNEHGQYYAAVLYSTECVRYYENGKLQVLHNGWASQSTAAFIHAVSPLGAHISNNRLWVSGEMLDGGRDSLWFEKVARPREEGGGCRWECTNPRKYFINLYNKETTKRIRSNPVVKHMQHYLKTMRAVGAYDGLVSGMNSNRIHNAKEALSDIIRSYRPDQDQDLNSGHMLEILAKLGDALRNVVPWDSVYAEVLQQGWVTREELYIPIEVTGRGLYRRGVYIA